MAVADRYVRTGTPVPQIYCGTLRMLREAERDTRAASRRHGGDHSLFALYGREWHLLRVYEAGECTWSYAAEG